MRGGGGRAEDGGERGVGGWKVVTLGWKNLEEYKGVSDEKGWWEWGKGGCELAAVEVGRDLCLPNGSGWQWAGRVRGATGEVGGAMGRLMAPAAKQ